MCVEQRTEDVFDEALKGGWCIGKAERHDAVLEQPECCLECRVCLGRWVNAQKVECGLQVDFGENGGTRTTNTINEIGRQWDGKTVAHGQLVEWAVIDAWAQNPLFFFTKKIEAPADEVEGWMWPFASILLIYWRIFASSGSERR